MIEYVISGNDIGILIDKKDDRYKILSDVNGYPGFIYSRSISDYTPSRQERDRLELYYGYYQILNKYSPLNKADLVPQKVLAHGRRGTYLTTVYKKLDHGEIDSDIHGKIVSGDQKELARYIYDTMYNGKGPSAYLLKSISGYARYIDVDDVIQETGLVMLDKQKRGIFENIQKDKFKSYMAGIARNIAGRHYKKYKREVSVEIDDMKSTNDNPANIVVMKDIVGEVVDTIKKSSAGRSKTRLSVLERYLSGDSYAKISEDLEITVRSTESILARINDVVRRIASNKGYDHGKNPLKSLKAEYIKMGIPFGDLHKAKLSYQMDYKGLNVAIESHPANERSGIDKDGKPWSIVMNQPYGYIKGSLGVDGDAVDVFIGPNQSSENVYVIHQNNPDGTYDEDKVMLGFNDANAAKEAYLSNYNRNDLYGSMTKMSVDELKDKIKVRRGVKLEKAKIIDKNIILEKAKAGLIPVRVQAKRKDGSTYMTTVYRSPEDVSDGWMNKLLGFFGIKKKEDIIKKGKEEYLKIKDSITSDEGSFISHWIEYWKNKDKWDEKFSKPAKDHTEKTRNATPGTKRVKNTSTGDQEKINLNLMKLIYDMYNNPAENSIISIGDLHIERYSDKAILVTGDTLKNVEILREIKNNTGRGSWNSKLKGWIFPSAYEKKVIAALKDSLQKDVELLNNKKEDIVIDSSSVVIESSKQVDIKKESPIKEKKLNEQEKANVEIIDEKVSGKEEEIEKAQLMSVAYPIGQKVKIQGGDIEYTITGRDIKVINGAKDVIYIVKAADGHFNIFTKDKLIRVNEEDIEKTALQISNTTEENRGDTAGIIYGDEDMQIEEGDDKELMPLPEKEMRIGMEDIMVYDYLHIPASKIKTISQNKILTTERPPYIPEIDINDFYKNGNRVQCIKVDENKYLISYSQKKYQSKYALVSLDNMAAINDYYIKYSKEKYKKEAEEKKNETYKKYIERGLSEAEAARIASKYVKPTRVMVISDKKMTYSQARMIDRFHGLRNDYASQLKRWAIYREIRGNVKQKTIDMETFESEMISSYTKGKETSYGKKGRRDILRDEYGVYIKRQNGEDITSRHVDDIKMTLNAVYETFGSMKDLAKRTNLLISHAANKRMHARTAVGVFIPRYNAIGVSNSQFGLTMAHEFAHFMDYHVGKKKNHNFSSDEWGSTANRIAKEFRDNMNEVQKSDYQNRTCECFARALEQYFAHKNDLDDISKNKNQVSKEKFDSIISPLIDKWLSENRDLLKASGINSELLLEKAKSMPVGTTSVHGGVKVIKTAKGWVPVGEESKKKDTEKKVSPKDKISQDKKKKMEGFKKRLTTAIKSMFETFSEIYQGEAAGEKVAAGVKKYGEESKKERKEGRDKPKKGIKMEKKTKEPKETEESK